MRLNTTSNGPYFAPLQKPESSPGNVDKTRGRLMEGQSVQPRGVGYFGLNSAQATTALEANRRSLSTKHLQHIHLDLGSRFDTHRFPS
jgi:hypothetical protein